MAVITLTSDYGLKDHYVAALKGALYREIDAPQIVDVTHLIQAFDITEAAFILRNAYMHFPENSIHLLCVDEEALPEKRHIVAKINGHFFVAANNGIISMISPEYKPEILIEVDFRNAADLISARDVFARVAGHLSRGGKPELLGRPIAEMKRAALPNPILREEGRLLIGTVIYIDRFGNLVTNLSKKQITEEARGRQFKIKLPKGRKDITKVLTSYYEESEDGKALAIFNSAGLLEIAIFKSGTDTHGGASELLGMRKNDHLTIEFS